MHTKKEPSVAVIGAGYWGRNLIRNFYELGVLHTVCDYHLPLLVPLQKQYPIYTTQFAEEIWRSDAIREVVLATPAANHYDLAKQALLAGKDLFVEKPLALKAAEGEELVWLAQKHDRVLMTGHLLHYHPCIQHLKQSLQEGAFGTLYSIFSNRLNWGKLCSVESALWSLAPHDVSVILGLCGAVPEQVQCTMAAHLQPGVADYASLHLEYASGVKGQIQVSWLHPYKEQKLTIIGSEGIAAFDDTLPWEEKLSWYPKPIERNPLAEVNRGGVSVALKKLKGESVVVPRSEPLRKECEHFLTCCNQRMAPMTDGVEGVTVLHVLERAEKSHISGQKEAIKLVKKEPFLERPKWNGTC